MCNKTEIKTSIIERHHVVGSSKNHCTITSDAGLSVPVWLIMMTSSMSSQPNCNLLKFSMCFFDFSRLQVNLWPQSYHQKDRKKTENLLIFNSKKMRILTKKILEVAIGRRLQTFARFLLFAYVIETKKSILNSILTYLNQKWIQEMIFWIMRLIKMMFLLSIAEIQVKIRPKWCCWLYDGDSF